jgi:CRP/FNR family transcriptional regulator, cyclic AMP receptor protein
VRRATRNTKIETLKRAPIFDGLSRKELNELAKVTDEVEFLAGEVLCREGTRGQEFFVIIEGEADVLRNGKRIATYRSGEFFGEIALVADVQRTATVTAKTPLRFFVMTRQSFLWLLDANPGVERKVLRALAKRLASLSTEPAL